jgi:copper chaperone NosL
MINKLSPIFLLALLLVGVAAACSPGAAVDQPPAIRYGEDACDHCQMIINEPRFAASYVTAGRETRRFDDIGNMMSHYGKYKEDVAAFWVHDYETEEWLAAEEAYFVVSRKIYTPMGHGIIALDDAERAASLAIEHEGQVVTFSELVAHYRSDVSQDNHQHTHGDNH